MHAGAITLLFVLLGAVSEDSAAPPIVAVRTWHELVEAKPRQIASGVRVRLGISTKTCAADGVVVLYCLAEGSRATERHSLYQVGPLPFDVERDRFSEAFWGLATEPSRPMVGGHPCPESPDLFMFPIMVTRPADATYHPDFDSFKKAFGPKYDPGTKAELTIRVPGSDERARPLRRGTGLIGFCRLEVAEKAQQPWVPLALSLGKQELYRVAAPAWDPLLPIALPKNLEQPLPALFPDEPIGELVLTYAARKLVLRSSFPLAEDPGKRLLARYWRGGKSELSKTGLLHVEGLSRSSEHEYTIDVTAAGGVRVGESVGLQVLYNELGWIMVDPTNSADVISDRTRPLPPVVSNRVDFIVEAEKHSETEGEVRKEKGVDQGQKK
jgi:hypothetical protein